MDFFRFVFTQKTLFYFLNYKSFGFKERNQTMVSLATLKYSLFVSVSVLNSMQCYIYSCITLKWAFLNNEFHIIKQIIRRLRYDLIKGVSSLILQFCFFFQRFHKSVCFELRSFRFRPWKKHVKYVSALSKRENLTLHFKTSVKWR